MIPVNKVTRNLVPGRLYAFIGPNGAGKSYLLKTCFGIYQPKRSKVLLVYDDIKSATIFDLVRKGMGVKNQKTQGLW